MRRNSNAGKVILILVVIAAVCGGSFLAARGIIRGLSDRFGIREEFQEVAAPDDSFRADGSGKTAIGESAPDTGNAQDKAGSAGAEQSPAPVSAGLEHRLLASMMDADMQENFLELCRSVEAFEATCVLPHPCSESDVSVLMELLHYECPELFQFDNGSLYQMTNLGDKVLEIKVPYNMGMEQYLEERKLCEEEVARITAIAAQEGTDYDRELAAYREFCRGGEYDLNTDRCALAVGTLIEKRGKCDGISLGFKWLMDELDIPCIVVSGENRTPGEIGHAWNMVMIDGTWYCVDVTAEWPEERTAERGDSCLYPAFNISEDWQLSRYYLAGASDVLDVPRCNTMEGSWHMKNGSYVTASDQVQDAFNRLMDRARTENADCLIQLEDPDIWQSFREQYLEWTNSWMTENGIYGSAGSLTVEEYHVVRIRLEINENSGRLNELAAQVDLLNEELTEQKGILDAKQAEINGICDRMNGIMGELDAMEQAGIQDEESLNRYNGRVADYNALLEEYNRAGEEYSRMVEQYNAKCVDQQNMIDEYNRMMGQ